MLPPAATEAMEHLKFNVISFLAIAVAGAFIAMLLARSFGGKSKTNREIIFGIVSFIGVCAAAYFAS